MQGMNVSNNTAADNSTAARPVENKQVQLQALLLRKMLDSQAQQSAELEREASGKGQIIDLRV